MGIPTILRGNVEEGDIVLPEGEILVGDSGGNAVGVDVSAGGNIAVGNDTTMVALDASADTKILVGNGTTITSVATSGDVTMTNTGAVTIANDAINEAKTADSDGTSGLYVAKYAIATYDFATDGGTIGAITLTDAVTIPDNAVVELVSYDVLTTCTSEGADAGTLKLNLVTDGDLSTAIAISDGTDPWDQGVNLGSVVTPIIQKTTAARLVQVTVATQNFTAGKVAFCIRYWVSS
jgi:hypothetical protein